MDSETNAPEGITWSDNASEIFAALARAQAKMRTLNKDRHVEVKHKAGGKHEFSYATLGATLEVMIDALSSEGIGMMQPVSTHREGVSVRTVFVHGGDGGTQWIKGPAVWLSSRPGAQDVGSAITYAKRYSAQGMGAIAGVDDDGTSAQDNAPEEWTQPDHQQRTRQPADHREGQPRCSGKAAGIAEGNVSRTRKLAAFEGTGSAKVWLRVCSGLNIPPDYRGNGAECPEAARLMIDEGKAVRGVLDAAIEVHHNASDREPGDDGSPY